MTAATPLLEKFFGDAERHDALMKRGYTPPTFFASATDPRSTAGRSAWWAQHFMGAEYKEDGTDYPKMPDTYNPGSTKGQGLNGNRRLHRMRYTDGDVTVRMPSVTNIKRFSKEPYAGSTFDIPIEAIDESFDPPRAIQCQVRVTTSAPGVWTAEALGLNGVAKAKISEAVAARLEARRPSLGPSGTGDLIERYKERLASEGIEAEGTRSSWISALGYDNGVMVTVTSNGKGYGHHVDPKRFKAVQGSTSPGKAWSRYVKGSPVEAITQCGKCGRWHATSGEHRCRVAYQEAPTGAKEQNLLQRQAAQALATAAEQRRVQAQQAQQAASPRVAQPRPKASSVPPVVRRRPGT